MLTYFRKEVPPMKTLYIATSFQSKMIERNLFTVTEETDIIRFKNVLIAAGKNGYQIKFAVTISTSTEKLIKLLDLSIEGEVVGKIIDSEEVKYGDIVLLAAPTQSCIFRYFIITLHVKKKCEECKSELSLNGRNTVNEKDQTVTQKVK